MPVGEEQLRLFTSLFNGRRDVYAKRWETKDKNGYSPGYDIDWSQYELHKVKGGTIKDYPNKTYSALTNDSLIRHFEGKDVVGIYPLLENNTSWFAALLQHSIHFAFKFTGNSIGSVLELAAIFFNQI